MIISAEPPLITQPNLHFMDASVGTDVRLACECNRCEPLTAFAWSITSEQLTAVLTPNQQPFRENIQVYVERPWQTNPQSRNYALFHLNIANVTAANEGRYECRLSNEHSIDRRPSIDEVFVKVVESPNILGLTLVNSTLPTSENGPLVAMRGAIATLFCQVTGRPMPKLEWFKDGKPYEHVLIVQINMA